MKELLSSFIFHVSFFNTMVLSLETVLRETAGRLLRGSALEFSSYAIDSRKVQAGSLFFALKGEQTDGHLFVNAALDAGAQGAIVQYDPKSNGTLLLVEDSLKALYDLAAFVRQQSQARFVGITGSAGKTSTKEFTAAILAERFRVYKSEGNLNSTTGLPLSILAMEDQQRAVFEAGMNHPGEIAALGKLLRPDIAVLLNVNPVHMGHFQSEKEIAIEKASLTDSLQKSGTIIFNADDTLLIEQVRQRNAKRISFGKSKDADLRIDALKLKGVRGLEASLLWQGKQISVESSLCGLGNAYNIAAAVCVALVEQLDVSEIENAVRKLTPYAQRGVLVQLGEIHIYDDSYNSNPRALEIALQLIAASEGFKRRAAVIGDMLELGSGEIEYHASAGRTAAKNKIDVLITSGPLSRHLAEAAKKNGVSEVHSAENSTEAGEIAAKALRPGDIVLVKGSRGMKMETVIERLRSL
jgi:UDP-N-acetylmuramoyl-tripeptide--D-alanyl-D-alanine ligase